MSEYSYASRSSGRSFRPRREYTEKVADRPPMTNMQRLNAFNFYVLFNLGILMTHFTQLLMAPLSIIPLPWAQNAWRDGIRYTKSSFGHLCILMSQLCGPSKFILTFEDEGQGRFTQKEIGNMVVRDKKGNILYLNLPQKTVVISNHQIYADWLYAWSFFSFMGTSTDVYIVLKRSLKWVPIIGWGMHFFKFIFLARNWDSDKKRLSKHLAELGERVENEDLPLSFLFFPEGTVYSKDTRPRSDKYADKEGIPPMQYTLLPRSTGLHYVLRSLTPRVPGLEVLDLTITYPGIPPRGIPQEYYTLRSIFANRVPPPAIHIHIRRFNAANDIPIGDLSASRARKRPSSRKDSGKATAVEVDVPERERKAFESWLRALWREKDVLFERYYDIGSFARDDQDELVIPLRLRNLKEYFDAFCFFGPIALWRMIAKLMGY